MKKFTVFLIAVAMFSFLSADVKSDKEAIKKLIQYSYIDGVFQKFNADAMAEGFYKDFSIFTNSKGEIKKYHIKDWMENTRKKKAAGKTLPWKLTWKLPLLDVTADAAVAKIEIFKDGKLLFTDYQSFYRMNGKWTIVAKIYQRH